MKIAELAKHTGLTAHTIRYYERIGLLPYALRDQARHRDYDASILPWIDFLGRLKTTGMPIQDMLRYATLRARGASTEADRRTLLEEHRARVRVHVADLQACLAALDIKIASYGGPDTKPDSEMENDHDQDTGKPIHRKPVRARIASAR
jgi:DNA-binding transcriptional MerR regulator